MRAGALCMRYLSEIETEEKTSVGPAHTARASRERPEVQEE